MTAAPALPAPALDAAEPEENRDQLSSAVYAGDESAVSAVVRAACAAVPTSRWCCST
ncbi:MULTISPECIES: hypothetical protein [Streptomyces]|uniref:hypothetical protein n=1 Tax=Streptomyces TaxID=1883 RepID=UPI0012B69972|nr:MULTISPECIES: hypothetical protein [Streptomyces]MYS96736.1 hypothetical protein [Streptomyces sp. SID5469]